MIQFPYSAAPFPYHGMVPKPQGGAWSGMLCVFNGNTIMSAISSVKAMNYQRF